MVERSAKEKTKEKPQKPEAKELKFPVKAKVNKYNFIHLTSRLMEAWSVKEGVDTPVSIDMQGDALIIRKA